MAKKLLVVAEVEINRQREGTRNHSLNTILSKYGDFFDEVHYLAPVHDDDTEPFRTGKVTYHPIKGYSKKLSRRLLFLLFFPFYKKNIKKVIGEIQPDVIQVRIPALLPLMIYGIIKKGNVPVTTYVAGEWDKAVEANNSNIPFSRALSKMLFRQQINIVKNTVPVTAGNILKERFSEVNDCHAYFSTTHDTVNRRQVISFPAYRILMVGRLEGLKRHEDAIRALGELIKVSPQYKLTFMGDGVLREKLKKTVEDAGLEQNVDFLGFISDREKIEDIYKNNDILLHASISEGSPKVLPEAMSFGLLPIAVKDVGSINSIITDGINGFLVPPKDPEAIYDTIIKYNSLGQQEAEKIIENCYRYAAEHTIGAELVKMWGYVFERIEKR
ncbi:MAG: glycosyltransferase [Alistipes sp.]|nr:glycosyltransferase [Alistipes sp.]